MEILSKHGRKQCLTAPLPPSPAPEATAAFLLTTAAAATDASDSVNEGDQKKLLDKKKTHLNQSWL